MNENGSPVSPLASLCFVERKMTRLTFITGERNAGKTSWCRRLARTSKQAGRQVAGLLSLGVYRGGVKYAIDLVDLQLQRRRRLATRDGSRPADGMAWRFDRKALAWGNDVLRQADGSDILVVDELGPLEFERGGGFQAGMDLLDHGRYNEAYVVVRPRLLAAATARWPGGEIVEIGEPTWRAEGSEEGRS